jgi:hypothetical protein
MKRYKVELIKDFDFSSELEFLSSPLGRFCREIHHKHTGQLTGSVKI